MSNNKSQKGHGLAKIATGLVAACAALITAVATQGVLVETKAIEYPLLAWAGTLLFEGGSVCVGYFVWLRGKAGKSAKFERFWFGTLLAIAVFVNGYHSYLIDGNVVGIALAALIPVVFIVSVETLIKNQDREFEQAKRPRSARKVSAAAPASGVASRAVAAGKPSGGERGRSSGVAFVEDGSASAAPRAGGGSSRSAQAAEKAEAVDRLLAENPGIVGREVAAVLGVSDQHGRKLLAAAKRRVEDSPVDTSQRP